MQDFEKESSFRLSLFNHYIYLFYFFTKQVPEFFWRGLKFIILSFYILILPCRFYIIYSYSLTLSFTKKKFS